MAPEDVEDVCLVSHEGDGTPHSTAHPALDLMRRCHA